MNVVIVIQLFEFQKGHFVKNIKYNDLHHWQRKDLKALIVLSMFLDLKKNNFTGSYCSSKRSIDRSKLNHLVVICCNKTLITKQIKTL
jgi:hypothetical protein